MKRLITLLSIIFLLQINISISLEKIKFTVKAIRQAIPNCIPENGQYFFYLDGEFDSSFNKEKCLIKLEYPDTTIECIAYSKGNYAKDSIKCEIDICEFTLDNNVLLSPEEPISEKIEFPNWNSFMNENPGVSNKVNDNDPSCYPNPKTNFNPTDIISVGCEGNKNRFNVKGNWDNENYVSFGDDTFRMPLSSQKGKKAECKFNNYGEFTCLFQGYGEIEFDQFYFKAILSAYRVNKLDKSIYVIECFEKPNENEKENQNENENEKDNKNENNNFMKIKANIFEILLFCIFLI